MTGLKRATLFALVLGLLFFLGLLLRSYLLENLVRPAAVLFWVFWRVLKSVDQSVYWGLMIGLACLYGLYRLTQKGISTWRIPGPRSGATIESISYWRNAILATRDEAEGPNILKNDLARILAAIYAEKQNGQTNYAIFSGIKQGDIPIPGSIYQFLFPADQNDSRPSLLQSIRTIRQTAGKWARRWAGRDRTEYHHRIGETIGLIEGLMEVPDGNDRTDTHHA